MLFMKRRLNKRYGKEYTKALIAKADGVYRDMLNRVADGRYSYLETGSLISIKKNVKDILIPSEEMKIQVYPMDYEEFCLATGNNYELLKQIYHMGSAIGQATNRNLWRDFLNFPYFTGFSAP